MSRRTLSLSARLTAATAVLLASLAVAAIGLHVWRVGLLTAQTQRRALNAVADLGATQLSDAAVVRSRNTPAMESVTREFERWSGAALRQPGILATALGDVEGRVLQSLPPDADVAAVLVALRATGGGDGSCQANVLGRNAQKLWVAVRPLGRDANSAATATLLVVAQQVPPTAAWASWLAFGVPLGVIAALGCVAVYGWLRRRILRPLDMLLRRPNETVSDWLKRLPTERGDQLGLIARETGDLVTELNDLHAKLGHLQHTLDSRVALRTRQINSELKQARRQTWIDPLTGLGNRRLLDDRLGELLKIERDGGGELSLVMFDIDNFKTHNDTMGHAAGDDLLRFVGQLLRGSLRETDLAIRYAGDEFLILLPEVSLDDAVKLADRIVRLFAQRTSLFATSPTLSAGVASSDLSAATSPQRLIDLADGALYRAKRRGKNGVCAAGRQPKAAGTVPAKRDCPRVCGHSR